MKDHNNGCKMIDGEFTKYHEYNKKNCPNCEATFCYSCCGRTNVDQGGKHEPDYMTCPVCEHDYYKK